MSWAVTDTTTTPTGTRVMGLDLSLRHAGIAHADGDIEVLNTEKLRGPARIEAIVNHIEQDLWGPVATAVIEGYAYGAQGRAMCDLAELGGVVRWILHRAGVPWIVVPPASLKCFATGKAGANKTEMVIAARERLGYVGTDHNEADALWLRTLGYDLLDEPVVSLPFIHRKVLGRLRWPEGVISPVAS